MSQTLCWQKNHIDFHGDKGTENVSRLEWWRSWAEEIWVRSDSRGGAAKDAREDRKEKKMRERMVTQWAPSSDGKGTCSLVAQRWHLIDREKSVNLFKYRESRHVSGSRMQRPRRQTIPEAKKKIVFRELQTVGPWSQNQWACIKLVCTKKATPWRGLSPTYKDCLCPAQGDVQRILTKISWMISSWPMCLSTGAILSFSSLEEKHCCRCGWQSIKLCGSLPEDRSAAYLHDSGGCCICLWPWLF